MLEIATAYGFAMTNLIHCCVKPISIFQIKERCFTNILDELTESQLVHTAVQCLLDQGTVMGDRFIETVAAGKIISIKPEPGQNPAFDIAAQAALTDHIDRLAWLQFRNTIP